MERKTRHIEICVQVTHDELVLKRAWFCCLSVLQLSEQSAASVHRGLFNSVSCCLERSDQERGMILLISQRSHTVQLERGAFRDVGIIWRK